MSGATAIVAAMATEAWDVARDRAVQLFRRRGSDRQTAVAAQLEDNAVLVAHASDGERARRALIGRWQLELEEFLAADPDATAELQALIDDIRSALPTGARTWVQHNEVSGLGTGFFVQGGDQHITFMDAGPPTSG